MEIKKYEFKKIICSPIFIALTFVFLAYNTFIIIDKSYINEDLKILNEIVDEVGYSINDEMMIEFKTYYENELNKANELLIEKGYSSYEFIGGFLKENNIYYSSDSKFSSYEIEFLNKVNYIEVYYFLSTDLEEGYETIDIDAIGEAELEKSPYNSNVNKIIKDNYDKFSQRFEELKSNGEHKSLFFYGNLYKMHSFLFKKIISTIIYEIMILVVLVTAFILNYEFESNNALVAYSTKRGRDLIKDKLIVSLGFTVFITTVIIGITILIYFSVFDYSGLFGTSISNFFGQEYSIPYMSWFNMSILNYLLASIVVVYLVEIIFYGITFILFTFIKNTYLVFGSFAIMLGGGLLLPEFSPSKLNIIIASVYTPFTLIFNPSWWFMLKDTLNINKYYEVVTLIVWSIGTLIIGKLCVNKFKKESIKG